MHAERSPAHSVAKLQKKPQLQRVTSKGRLGLYKDNGDNGKENGNYYISWKLLFRV